MVKLREQSFRKKSSFRKIIKNMSVLILILILMNYLKG